MFYSVGVTFLLTGVCCEDYTDRWLASVSPGAVNETKFLKISLIDCSEKKSVKQHTTSIQMDVSVVLLPLAQSFWIYFCKSWGILNCSQWCISYYWKRADKFLGHCHFAMLKYQCTEVRVKYLFYLTMNHDKVINDKSCWTSFTSVSRKEAGALPEKLDALVSLPDSFQDISEKLNCYNRIQRIINMSFASILFQRGKDDI